jgi:hypothetical protein
MALHEADSQPRAVQHLWCRDRRAWVLQRWSDGRWAVFERYEALGTGHAWTVVPGRYLFLPTYGRPSASDFPSWVPVQVAQALVGATA